MCPTLFNMGNIYKAEDNNKEAIDTWLKVYVIAKEINSAQALDALTDLAEKLDMKGGLDAWKALLDK